MEVTLKDIEIVCKNSNGIKPINSYKSDYEFKDEKNLEKYLEQLDKTEIMSIVEFIEFTKSDKNKESDRPILLVDNSISDKINKLINNFYDDGPNDELEAYLLIDEIFGLVLNYKDIKLDLKDNRKVYKNMAKILYELLEFKSFDDVIDRLKLYLENLLDLLFTNFSGKNNKKINNIYFLFDGIITKSNTWIFLLFMTLLIENKRYDEFKTHFSKKCKFRSYLSDKDMINNNDICLHFDDMPYSGIQSSNLISSSLLLYYNKNVKCYYYLVMPYYTNSALSKYDEKILKFIKKYGSFNDKNSNELTIEKIKKNILLNKNFNLFLDETGNGLINNINDRIKNNESEVFNSLSLDEKNQIKFMLHFFDGINDEYKKNLEIISNKCFYNGIDSMDLSSNHIGVNNFKPLIYFQHKMADYVSIPYYFYAYTSPPNHNPNSNSCNSYPLIKNCDINKKQYDDLKKKSITHNNCKMSLDSNPCLETYYKSSKVEYKYNDNFLKLNDDNNNDNFYNNDDEKKNHILNKILELKMKEKVGGNNNNHKYKHKKINNIKNNLKKTKKLNNIKNNLKKKRKTNKIKYNLKIKI